ncbi:MAG: hypothetical protein NC922_08635 [Candidatus Omnitrophica bacterium]|nr:hypothetical protein [Candidatus Omnitrophota bacterium]
MDKELKDFLFEKKEFFASGFFENESASPILRIARGIKRQLENVELEKYNGTYLYPSGKNFIYKTYNNILNYNYSYSIGYSKQNLENIINISKSEEKEIWKEIKRKLDYYFSSQPLFEPKYTIGGKGYTHSIPNYEKVLK